MSTCKKCNQCAGVCCPAWEDTVEDELLFENVDPLYVRRPYVSPDIRLLT